MMLSLKNRMGRMLGASGFRTNYITLAYGTGKQMGDNQIGGISVMEEIEAVDFAMSKNFVDRPLPFRAMEAESAKSILDERKEHRFSPKAMVESGWSPFQDFWFKKGWSRIIFHNCKDGVRPYVCGDTIDFAGCKVCEKLMPPEVWAARELLRDWTAE